LTFDNARQQQKNNRCDKQVDAWEEVMSETAVKEKKIAVM